jgi:membrane-associated phospholipid phosphatase
MDVGMQVVGQVLQGGVEELGGNDRGARECDDSPPERLEVHSKQRDDHTQQRHGLVPETVLRAQRRRESRNREPQPPRQRLILLTMHGLANYVTSTKKAILTALALSCATLLPAEACRAQSFTPGDVLTDAKLYFTAPLRWDSTDWLYFGGTLAAIGVAHEADGKVRGHYTRGDPNALDGKDTNSTRDAIPAAAVAIGTMAFATLLNNSSGRVEAYTMFEAAAFSTITTEALKYAAGRARPNETSRVDDWRSGGSSFPSLHVSAAFAIGTVFAESGSDDFRWLRRLAGYGMAVGTAYLRVHDNGHWLSDTVAGAAIGISTGGFTLNRREQRANHWDVSVAPAEGGGVSVSARMVLH